MTNPTTNTRNEVLKKFGEECWEICELHGRHKDDKGSRLETAARIAHMHAELSEVLDDLLNNRLRTEYRDSDGCPKGFATQLADVVFLSFDLAKTLGLDLPDAIDVKLAYLKAGKPTDSQRF